MRFFFKSEQSYKFLQSFRTSGVVNSISEKKKKEKEKKDEECFFNGAPE